jgi:hypothetical protein
VPADLGLSPWDVLPMWIPRRERSGLGTATVDLTLLWARAGYLAFGL